MPERVRCETNAVCLSLSLTNPEDEKCIMKPAEQENRRDYAGCGLEECCSREQTHLRVRTDNSYAQSHTVTMYKPQFHSEQYMEAKKVFHLLSSSQSHNRKVGSRATLPQILCCT